MLVDAGNFLTDEEKDASITNGILQTAVENAKSTINS